SMARHALAVLRSVGVDHSPGARLPERGKRVAMQAPALIMPLAPGAGARWFAATLDAAHFRRRVSPGHYDVRATVGRPPHVVLRAQAAGDDRLSAVIDRASLGLRGHVAPIVLLAHLARMDGLVAVVDVTDRLAHAS